MKIEDYIIFILNQFFEVLRSYAEKQTKGAMSSHEDSPYEQVLLVSTFRIT